MPGSDVDGLVMVVVMMVVMMVVLAGVLMRESSTELYFPSFPLIVPPL